MRRATADEVDPKNKATADEADPKNKATADEADPRTHVHHSERHSRVPTPDAGRADPCLAGRCICQFCQSGLKARMEGFEPSDPFGSPVFGTGCLLD